MSAFYFGPPERRLFGLFEAAQARSGTAALLCYPYGAEAIRTHRVYRVLSERLTRAVLAATGHVLRDAYSVANSDTVECRSIGDTDGDGHRLDECGFV